MNKIAAYSAHDEVTQSESLILSHLALVKSIAQHIHCRLPQHIVLDDLISCGVIGLVEAAQRFEQTQGVHFKTFAGHRIRGAIIDELRKTDSLTRHLQQEAKRLHKAIRLIEQSEGRAAHDAEVAKAMSLSIQDYEHLLRELNGHYTLSTEEFDLTNKPHTETEQPQQSIEKSEIKQLLSQHIETLPQKEKMVLALYYNEELNFKQVGEVLDVSESRVSQLHASALSRLKARMQSDSNTQ